MNVFFVVLCPEASEGSTGSGSGLKCLRRLGHRLKYHPTDWYLNSSGLEVLF